MADLNTPISYTNKDFRSIYEELLNLGKQLSHKWDPTITNESDPGIVLIKEKAITADKNNYNIDKNILESFPSTVTQEHIARQLFNQLGYKMPWYKAGIGELTLKWIGDDLYMTDVINIPKFTMITDEDNSVVYSTTEDVQINWTTKKYTTTVPIIQGMYVNFNVAGNPIITTYNIDNNNRLYLNDYNIAENGIFITNVDDANIEWTQVPNILLYPNNSYVYEFNIDPSTNLCYLKFPSDYDSLIGSGLTINYILTNGYEGNIKARTLSSFYNDTAVTIGKEKVQLNSENMILYNTDAITDGCNPLNIDQSYNEYKRTVGTFDNLVTLRDYVNAIYNTNLVSNAQVSDRYHDIQTSYQVLTDESGIVNCVNKNIKVGTNNTISYKKVQSDDTPIFAENTYYKYENNQMILLTEEGNNWDNNWPNYYTLYSNEEEDLTAYDLRLYLLKSSGKIKTLTDFKTTFELEECNSKRTNEIKQAINDQKCVQHNYKDILKDIPCLFRNIYPVNIKIIPQYKLSDTQQIDVKNNIFRALIESLNSRNIQFSEEPDYDAIYNTIMNADNRIKVIILDDFEYTTYASYWDGEKFKHVPISEFKDKNIIVANTKKDLEEIIKDKDFEYNKEECLYIATGENNKCYIYKDKKLELYSNKITPFRTDIIAKSVLAGKTTLFDIDQQFRYVINQTHKKQYTDVDKISTELILAPFGATVNDTVTNIDGEKIPKNLTGTQNIGEGAQAEYTLRDNESLQLYAPAFTTKKSYSNYVKYVIGLKSTNKSEYVIKKLAADEKISENNPVYLYEYDDINKLNKYVKYTYDKTVTGNDGTTGNITKLVSEGKLTVYTKQAIYRIEANEEYKLKKGDYIYFFYKESDEQDASYIYERYEGIENETDVEKSPVIKANFNIKCNNSGDSLINKFYNQFNNNSGEIFYSDAADSPYQTIASLYGDNDLSGTKQIDMRTINQVFFDTSVGEKYYFITNNIVDIDGKEQYKLSLHKINNTNTVKNEYEYILKDDEFFIYINKEKTAYEIAGSGTLIKIYENKNAQTTESKDIYDITVDKIEESVISELGLDSFVDSCISINGDVLVREQQIYNLTSGDTLYLTLNENYFTYETKEANRGLSHNIGIPRILLVGNAEKININSIKLYYKENNSDSEYKEISYKSEVLDNVKQKQKQIVITPEYTIPELSEDRNITKLQDTDIGKYATINYIDKYNVVNYEASKYYIEDVDDKTSQTIFRISNDSIMNEYDNYYSIPKEEVKVLPVTNLSVKFVNNKFYTYSTLTNNFELYNSVVSSTDNTPVTPNDWGSKIYFTKNEEGNTCDYSPIPLKHRYKPYFEFGRYYVSNTIHSTNDEKEYTLLPAEPDDWGRGTYYGLKNISQSTTFVTGVFYKKMEDGTYTLLTEKPDDWDKNYKTYYIFDSENPVTFTPFMPLPKNDNEDKVYKFDIQSGEFILCETEDSSWEDENTLFFEKVNCDYSPVQITQLSDEELNNYPYFSDNGDVIIDNFQYYYFNIIDENDFNNYIVADISSVLDTYNKEYYFINRDKVKQIVPFKENTYYVKYTRKDANNIIANGYRLVREADIPPLDADGEVENYGVLEAVTLDYEILDPKIHTDLSRINTYQIYNNYTTNSRFKVKYDQISKDTTAPVFRSNSITSLKGCEVKYKSSDSEDVISALPVINIHDDDSNWKCVASLNINSDYNKSQVIKSANSNKEYNKYSNEDVFEKDTYYEFKDGQYKLLTEQPSDWGTGIYYKASDSYTSIQLYYIPNPVYELLTEKPEDWDTGIYYKLEDNKYIEVDKTTSFEAEKYYAYKKDKLDLLTLLNDDVDITTNVAVQKLGGNNIDVTYLDLYGNRKKITLLAFINSKLENDLISLDAEDNISINLNHNEKELTNLKIASASFDKDYYYILPIRNASDKVKYTLSIKGAVTKADQNILKYNLHKPGIQYGKGMQYYLFKVKNNSTTVNFKMDIDGSDNTNIIIYPLVKYKESDIFDKYSIKVEDVIERMQTLDEENQYKYNYIIPIDKLIKDPLESKTFFDENHICNRFTIAQADMDLTNLGSSLDIINNR